MHRRSMRMVQFFLLFFIIGAANTWDAYYSYSLQGRYLTISDSTIHSPQSIDSVDIIFDGTEFINYCYTKYANYLWLIEDSSSLNFNDSLDLSDTSMFDRTTYIYFEMDSSTSELFVLGLLSGNYALCKADVENVFTCLAGECYLQLSDLYLACQVQDDGTTKFDSIPQYPYDSIPSIISTPTRTNSMNPQGPPYRVNGARAASDGAMGVRVRAMGKE